MPAKEIPKKAFVPGYEWDIFISYARAADYQTSPSKPEQSWVHDVVDRLAAYTDERLKRHGAGCRVFVDTWAVDNSAEFQQQVNQAVQSSAILIVFLSDA